jgi:hypothetical protein
VAGPKPIHFLHALYSGTSALRRAGLLAGVLAATLVCGGCSLSMLDSFSGGDKSDQTGSISPPPGAKEAAALPPDGDLVYTRLAVSEVLNRAEKDASVPWENPHTGARGTVTPIAAAYNSEGHTCRDFLASYISGSAQSWLQGEACQQEKGKWEVRAIKPWKRS